MRNGIYHFTLIALTLILLSDSARATDRSSYHLFNPVPSNEMRPLATDRPDRTESPYTVDPGHFQFEIDLFNQVRDASTTESLVGGINAKAGLTDSIDL